MKRILIFWMTAVFALGLGLLSACGTDPDYPTRSLTTEISGIEYGFVETTGQGDPDLDAAQKYVDLRVDTVYYLFFRFSLTPRTTNYGGHTVGSTIVFEKIDVLNGRMEEVGSGDFSELIFTDDMGETSKRTEVTFTVPSQKEEVKTIEILLRLTPVQAGQSYVKLSFASENSGLTGDGRDGQTINVAVDRIELSAPELSVEGGASLTFPQVKNADYYKLIVDGETLTVDGREYILEADPAVAAGRPVTFSKLSELLGTGTHRVRVQAFARNANYLTSAPSNEVTVTL